MKATQTPRRGSYLETSVWSLLLNCAVRNACSLQCPKGLCGSQRVTNHAWLALWGVNDFKAFEEFFFFKKIKWVF